MVGGIGSSTSGLVVWLRGGTAAYHVFSNAGVSLSVTVHTSSFTDDASQTFAPKTARSSIAGYQSLGVNASSASHLATSRTINGTAFNGSANIVTSYWGTARNFYIRDHDSSHTGAAVSVNGSANEYLLLPSTITATLNGNATSASYWQTARTLTVSGDATGSVSIRGNANMSLSLDVKYATSAGNADTVDSLHASAFARKDQNPAVDLNTVNGNGIMTNPANANATTARHYPIQEAGTLFYGAAAYNSANQIYGTFSSNRWFFRGGGGSTTTKTAWKEMAFLTSNVASATKLQNSRTIWGQSFNGTANVSGALSGATTISASSNITTTGGYFYCSVGWFQNSKSGCGLYNSVNDARWYANSSGWISDKKINANAGLGVSGTTTLGGAVQVPYTAGSWISMATRTNLIYSTANNSQSNAHALFRVKAYNGNAICFGGLGNNVGFYAFTAANISSGTNAQWHNTNWDMTNWKLTHGGALAVSGAVTFSSTLAVTGAITGSSTVYAKTGVYSDGYVSAKGQNTSSDLRLKDVLSSVRPSLEAFAKAPLFRFAWKSDPGMVEIGSSAQYWRNVLPDTVKERDGWLEMGYGNIALAGVITIARDFETLEQRVDRLEKENGKLKKRIKELERRAA